MLDRRRSRAGRPTPAQLDVRKARVLSVAAELFLKQGFAATTMGEIARLAKVTPRLISSHFGQKAQIFTDIIRQANVSALDAAQLPGRGGSLEETLLGAARFAMATAYSDRSIRFLRIILGEASRLTDMTGEIARHSSAHFFGTLEPIFADLIERELLPPGDPARMAKYFVDLIIGFALVQTGMGFPDRVSSEAELRDKIAFFVRAVRSA